MGKNNTEKEFIKWIEEQIDFYKPFLGIELQNIKVEKDLIDTPYLTILVTYPYLDPTIRFGKTAIHDFQNGKLKKDRILHELCHILTDPLYCKSLQRIVSKEEIEDERERLTDTIAAIIRNLTKDM